MTIEGIAIKDDATLYAGFRGPVLKGDEGKSTAVVLSAPLDALFDGRGAQHRLFRLPLGPGRGVRDLAAFEDGILILGRTRSVSMRHLRDLFVGWSERKRRAPV